MLGLIFSHGDPVEVVFNFLVRGLQTLAAMKKTFTATVSVTNYYTVRNKSCLHPWKPV